MNESHTVVDKRHHQLPVMSVDDKAEEVDMAAPEAPKGLVQVSLEDLSIGLVIGQDKAKGELVFQVVGQPNLAEVLGMGIMIQDQVNNLKEQHTNSHALRQDQQFMVLSQTMGKLLGELNAIKQMMLIRK